MIIVINLCLLKDKQYQEVPLLEHLRASVSLDPDVGVYDRFKFLKLLNLIHKLTGTPE